MRPISRTPQFERDLKKCLSKHWEIDAFKEAICALAKSDEHPLEPGYRDHALQGKWTGKRAIHVLSQKQPPRDKWVVVYELLEDGELLLIRTGDHGVYGGDANN